MRCTPKKGLQLPTPNYQPEYYQFLKIIPIHWKTFNMQERQLYLRIKSGDRTAFDELFRRHYANLVRQSYRKLQDQTTAEDIVQNVFIQFWNKREQITVKESVFAYLAQMARYGCIDFFRKQQSKAQRQEQYFQNGLNLDVKSPEEDLLQKENVAAIYAKVDALPVRCKTVFKLSRFEEMTYEQIAQELSISIKTVEYHISTALRLLRKSVFG
ncbi:MAG: RNA polymerase sigma factor [Saprospiraceae bacterium]